MPEKHNDHYIGNGNLQPYIVPSGYFAERDLINENIKSRNFNVGLNAFNSPSIRFNSASFEDSSK